MPGRMPVWFNQPDDQPDSDADYDPTDPSGQPRVLIDFGDNIFAGANISFGNVTGGSIIQITTFPAAGEAQLAPHETEEYLRAMAIILAERRALLMEQIAQYGDNPPIHLRLDLNQTERHLAEIETKLARCAGAAEE